MIRTMNGPGELWRMRKQFTLQLAATNFMTYVVSISARHPFRFHWSRGTGQIAMSEVMPGESSCQTSSLCKLIMIETGQAPQQPVCFTADVVPFRLTPNIQHFIGPVFTEGVLASGIMTIARCLTEPEVGSPSSWLSIVR